MKLESRSSRNPLLYHEYTVYRYLEGGPGGIPRAHYYGDYLLSNVLVMDLMGQNLSDLLKLCGGKFSLKTVLLIAD